MVVDYKCDSDITFMITKASNCWWSFIFLCWLYYLFFYFQTTLVHNNDWGLPIQVVHTCCDGVIDWLHHYKLYNIMLLLFDCHGQNKISVWKSSLFIIVCISTVYFTIIILSIVVCFDIHVLCLAVKPAA